MKYAAVGAALLILLVLFFYDYSPKVDRKAISLLERELADSREKIRKKDQGMSELYQIVQNAKKNKSVIMPTPTTTGGGPLDTANGYTATPWTMSKSPLFSSSHCIGQLEKTKLDPDHWKKGTCHFKNICFNPKSKEFLYYAKPTDLFDSEKNSVAIGAINEQWTPDDRSKLKWAPKIIRGALTEPHWVTPADELWIPHFEHCGANVMHLLMDSFYIIHAAALLFNLQNKHYKPFRYVLKNSTLWGTCDFIKQEEKKGTAWAKGYYSRCTKSYDRWAGAFLPPVDGYVVIYLSNLSSV